MNQYSGQYPEVQSYKPERKNGWSEFAAVACFVAGLVLIVAYGVIFK